MVLWRHSNEPTLRVDGAGAGDHVPDAVREDGMREDSRGAGAVANNIASLFRRLPEHLRPEIFFGILEIEFLAWSQLLPWDILLFAATWLAQRAVGRSCLISVNQVLICRHFGGLRFGARSANGGRAAMTQRRFRARLPIARERASNWSSDAKVDGDQHARRSLA